MFKFTFCSFFYAHKNDCIPPFILISCYIIESEAFTLRTDHQSRSEDTGRRATVEKIPSGMDNIDVSNISTCK